MNLNVIGIDIGKNGCHFVGLDQSGQIVLRRRLSRIQLLRLLANMPKALIGMEACCGAHALARSLTALGHDARLLPAQFVKPFLKGQKNDYRDAEAIAEAVQRPTMRFVPVKTPLQLDLQAVHRVRSGLVARRTAVINQIRAMLFECGITVAQSVPALRRALPEILSSPRESLSPRLLHLIDLLLQEWKALDRQVDQLSAELVGLCKTLAQCARLASVPGIGPITATALVVAIGDGHQFRCGRDLAAWLGLVPRQHSTGGRTKLLGITKRGNAYLRTLFIHGARSVMRFLIGRSSRLGRWMSELAKRAHRNVAAVALAAKQARLAWAILTTGQPYGSEVLAN